MPGSARTGRPPTAPREILQGVLAAGASRAFGDLVERTDASVDSWRHYVGQPDKSPGPMRVARLIDVREDQYYLGPGLGLVLALSMGGEHLIGALVDAGGRSHCVVTDRPQRHQLTGPPENLLARMAVITTQVLERGLREEAGLVCPTVQGGKALRLIGATAAWPAPMRHETTPLGGPLDPRWRQRTFREHLHGALGLPLERCHAMNNANAGALTLAFEQPSPRAGAVMCVHISGGIGLGTVHQAIPKPYRLAFVDAHLVGGRDGRAGELGHCVPDRSFLEELNAASKDRREHFGHLASLDPTRPCDCDPEAHGHLDAVVGAEAVLDRLGRHKPGDSLFERLAELRADAAHDPLVRLALRDAGRVIAAVMAGAIAATDPVSVTLVGSLASTQVARGMNEQFRKNNVAPRAVLYDQPDILLVGLRGAALAVLRGALYRGLFDRVKYSAEMTDGYALAEHWEGWDTAPTGAQTGRTSQEGSAWRYEPLLIDNAFLESLIAKTRRAVGAEHEAAANIA
jgi:predicted NBD/HSP70 family sugar kinase